MVKFTEEHEWLIRDGNDITVGITEFAVGQLGDIVFVELPEEGTEVDAGAEVAVIESVKAASDVFAPVSGIISEVNGQVGDNPTLVNEDPLGDGWLFKIAEADPAEYDGLMDEDDYNQLIQ